MKRYDIYTTNVCNEPCDCKAHAKEDADGDWCQASDVAELEAMVTMLHSGIVELEMKIRDGCGLVNVGGFLWLYYSHGKPAAGGGTSLVDIVRELAKSKP